MYDRISPSFSQLDLVRIWWRVVRLFDCIHVAKELTEFYRVGFLFFLVIRRCTAFGRQPPRRRQLSWRLKKFKRSTSEEQLTYGRATPTTKCVTLLSPTEVVRVLFLYCSCAPDTRSNWSNPPTSRDKYTYVDLIAMCLSILFLLLNACHLLQFGTILSQRSTKMPYGVSYWFTSFSLEEIH